MLSLSPLSESATHIEKPTKTGSPLLVSHCEGLSVGTIVSKCQVELGGENQSFVVLLPA
jgi:hypothetical protein